jgi:LPXTG-motif cell wall-anchored protein
MKALAAAYFLVAALAMPALLWAADDPPADPATATTPATPPGDPEPAQTSTPPAPAPEPAAQPAPPQAAVAPASAQPVTATEPGPAEEQTEPATAPRAAPKAHAAGSQSVPIQGFAFKPATVTVNEGDTVTWTNQDTAPHTATASDGSFDTGSLKKGASGSHTFSQAGSFAYICSIHPNMKGTVVVKAASSGNGGAGSSGSGSSGSGSSDSSGSSDTLNLDDSSGSGSGSDSSSLPNTGGDAAVIGLLGLLLLGAGALVRRFGRDESS